MVYESSVNGGSTLKEEAQMIREAYREAEALSAMGWFFGIDFEKLGRRCSIAVCLIMIIGAIYKIFMFVLRLIIVYGSEDSYLLMAVRVFCTQEHLLAMGNNDQRKIRVAKEEDNNNDVVIINNADSD